MRDGRVLWLAAALLSAGAAGAGIIGVLLEAPGQRWWLGLWYAGVIFGVGFTRRWNVSRGKSALGRKSESPPDGTHS